MSHFFAPRALFVTAIAAGVLFDAAKDSNSPPLNNSTLLLCLVVWTRAAKNTIPAMEKSLKFTFNPIKTTNTKNVTIRTRSDWRCSDRSPRPRSLFFSGRMPSFLSRVKKRATNCCCFFFFVVSVRSILPFHLVCRPVHWGRGIPQRCEFFFCLKFDTRRRKRKCFR